MNGSHCLLLQYITAPNIFQTSSKKALGFSAGSAMCVRQVCGRQCVCVGVCLWCVNLASATFLIRVHFPPPKSN